MDALVFKQTFTGVSGLGRSDSSTDTTIPVVRDEDEMRIPGPRSGAGPANIVNTQGGRECITHTEEMEFQHSSFIATLQPSPASCDSVAEAWAIFRF